MTKLAWQRAVSSCTSRATCSAGIPAAMRSAASRTARPDPVDQAAAIHGIDTRHFRGSQTAVVIGGRQPRAEGEMHHLIALIGELFEKFHVFGGVDGRRFRQDIFLAVNPIDFVGNQVHPVRIGLAVENNVKGKILHMVSFAQLVPQVARAVCAQDRLFTQVPIPPFRKILPDTCLVYHRTEKITISLQNGDRTCFFKGVC